MFLQLFIFADVPAVNNLNMKKILFAMFCALSMVCFFSCEPSFYRYDNVRITCGYYGIPLYGSLEELLQDLPL